MRWSLKPEPPKETINHLVEVLGVEPLIATLLAQRGVATFDQAKAFFRPSLEQLHDPYLMKDMHKAVDRLEAAFVQGERILVFGDYDVDGTTAVALMASYLRSIYDEVDTYIPDRYAEGYGVSTAGIDYAVDNGITLIVALDCGIKSIDKVEYARQQGVDFIICDHHLPGETVPQAVAVLDPKQSDCNYPYKELCGCGVGFKLVQALAAKRGKTIEDLMPYLDLVATAIGADIVPITGENRILAYYGLQVINENPRPGIKALLLQYKQRYFTITDIVFKVAPKINAAGRIEHGNFAVALLTQFTLEEAQRVAEQIVNFNLERRALDKEITAAALEQIERSGETDRKSTVVYEQTWHKGVIGIVASRLIETHYRPTLVFTKSGTKLAASARSVKNFDVYQALEACSDYLEQFGGHMYAAGLTLDEANYQGFKQRFEEVVAQTITDEQLIPEIEIDAEIDLTQIDEKFIRILKQFEPHGPDNMSPVFCTKNLCDHGDMRTLGSENEHLKLSVVQGDSQAVSSIGFGLGRFYPKLLGKQPFSMAYCLDENEWNGRLTMQFQIKDLKVENSSH
ncbi:single-stranded-DNA-specific exonuclease RecJ [Flavobacterium sp. JP2137]|uniref:single-stranded-DNA-specific exonuclease RecJ n=1 Tax=Flavobacterium sp. JP2137 TaxID=3414510 RepID=UPI003D2FD42E